MAFQMGTTGRRGSVHLNIARVRDYWLGGTHHTDDDRVHARQIELVAPHIPYLVRAQHSLIGRLVRFLVSQGVTQFLDLGSGLPLEGSVHRIAQDEDPRCRVLYVDADPAIVADGRQLLGDNNQVAFVTADVRNAETVFATPEFTELIDPAQPVGVLMIELLLHIPDADDPAGIVTSFVDAMCPGSYLALAHFGPDEQILAGFQLFEQMMFGSPPQVNLRSPEELIRFFSGLELVDPGLVPVPLWRPEPEDELGRNPEKVRMYAGLARKP